LPGLGMTMQFAVFHSGGWVPQVKQAVNICGRRWGAAALKWCRVVYEMSSGLTEVPYFRLVIAKCVSCSVTSLVWWQMSFVEVRRPGGSHVRGVVLSEGKSALRSVSHLPLKVVRPLRGGIGLWCVLWW